GFSRQVRQQLFDALDREVDALLVDLPGIGLPVLSKLEMRASFRQAHGTLNWEGQADDLRPSSVFLLFLPACLSRRSIPWEQLESEVLRPNYCDSRPKPVMLANRHIPGGVYPAKSSFVGFSI